MGKLAQSIVQEWRLVIDLRSVVLTNSFGTSV
jgi:hypothetical protein